jgi:hypothetical protein
MSPNFKVQTRSNRVNAPALGAGGVGATELTRSGGGGSSPGFDPARESGRFTHSGKPQNQGLGLQIYKFRVIYLSEPKQLYTREV